MPPDFSILYRGAPGLVFDDGSQESSESWILDPNRVTS